MIYGQACLSHRQGETRIPESSELGRRKQAADGWIRSAVLDIQETDQDGGNENIQEAGNRCLIRLLLLRVQGKAKANPKAMQFSMGTRQEIPGATTHSLVSIC